MHSCDVTNRKQQAPHSRPSLDYEVGRGRGEVVWHRIQTTTLKASRVNQPPELRQLCLSPSALHSKFCNRPCTILDPPAAQDCHLLLPYGYHASHRLPVVCYCH